MYQPGDSYFGEFTTQSPTTGAATDADSLPTATANRNGTDDAGFVLTVARVDTGRYKVTGTVPGGYALGDVVSISVAATVGGVSGKSVLPTFRLDSPVASRLATTGYTAPDNADIVTALADLVTLLGRTDPTTALTAVKAVTDKLADMIAGTAPNEQFTAHALALAPAGGGGSISGDILPGDADTCTIYGYAYEDDGETAKAGVTVTFTLEAAPLYSGSAGIAAGSKTVLSDANGLWQLKRPRGAIYTVDIPDERISRKLVRVPDNPDTTSVNLKGL